MDNIITKEIAKKFMEIEGETRGFNIKHDGDYILYTRGKEALEKLERELERLGYPTNYKKIKGMDFVPAGLKAISLLAIKKTFNVGDEEIRKVCAFGAKAPLIMKLFMKYIYSVQRVMKNTQKLWKIYWTVGDFIGVEYNEKEKRIILRIENFDLDPIFCRCIEGYLASSGEIVLGVKNIICKEKECSFEGGKYHEFLINWK